uniref:Auxin-responsive family protein n=1 Tax=Populus alba TaxID=43335 RepID=A0A4V6A1P1_POPAL|nr:auxin-responsive family protein [Populus alba]
MRKNRGFKIGKRFVRISTWIFSRTRIHPPGCNSIGPSESTCSSKSKSLSKIINWGRRLTKGAKSICSAKPRSGYIPVGHEPLSQWTRLTLWVKFINQQGTVSRFQDDGHVAESINCKEKQQVYEGRSSLAMLSQWKGPSLERSLLFHGNSRRRSGCVVISICMGRGQSVHSNEVSAQGPKLKQMQEEGRLVNLLNWSNGPSGIYEALYKVSRRSSSGQEEYVRPRVGMN